MSFGQQQNQFQAKPPAVRPAIGIEHQVDPVIEAVIQQRDALKQSVTMGVEVVKDTIKFDTPSGTVTLEAYKAMMMSTLCFAVPHDSPSYPQVAKLDCAHPTNTYYAIYKGLLRWKHDDKFWHIPGYSRYVIDKFCRILNAYNGTEIKINRYGSFELAPDCIGTYNKAMQVSKNDILMLSHAPLPDGFRDYGFKNYSHEIKFVAETKSLQWVKRPKIVARDSNGETAVAEGLKEFELRYVKEFNKKKELRDVTEDKLALGPCNTGSFMIRLEEEVATRPPINAVGSTTEKALPPTLDQVAPMSVHKATPATPSSDQGFGENDFDF